MSRKLRAAVLGAGKVAAFHARAYKDCEESELVAVVDRNLSRAKAFAERFDIRAYSSVEEMVQNEPVEVASVCTPHPIHRIGALECMNRGIHVAIEKPLASSLEDCDAILEAQKRTGVVGTTICQRRFYEPCMRIRRAIDEGRIGKPILGTVTMLGWRDMDYYHSDPWRGTWTGEGGGVLVNQAAHQIDLLLWYMGEVEELYGIWDTLNHPLLEVDDSAVAVIRFKSGALGSIVVSNSQNPALYGNIHVHGSNGASVGVQTDGGAMFIAGVSSISEPPVNDLWTLKDEGNVLETFKAEDVAFFNRVDATTYFHKLQIQDFLRAILEKRDPLITFEDGRRTVELFTAVYRSRRDHAPIHFPLKAEHGADFDGRI